MTCVHRNKTFFVCGSSAPVRVEREGGAAAWLVGTLKAPSVQGHRLPPQQEEEEEEEEEEEGRRRRKKKNKEEEEEGRRREVAQLCPTTILSMEFSRQEYWSGLRFPSPGDLPNPGIEPGSPALQADALLSEPYGPIRVFFQASRSQ